MAVSALELRPRGAVALFDASIRLVATQGGVWVLLLPSGALVAGTLLGLVEAIVRNHSVALPSVFFALAWCARGVCQGAACHFLGQQVLSAGTPTAAGSLMAALRRLPSLVTATAYLLFFNGLMGLFTVGLYYFFLGAQLSGYAVTMQGKGHPLALYQTCAKTMGPARTTAVWLRFCFFTQALVALNLHVGVNVLLLLAEKLLALDVTYANRFASVDNWSWVAVVVAASFALFEPLRASAATLLLIDGRVRQEGLDLLATIQELPKRAAPKSTPLGPAAALGMLLACVVGLAPLSTLAQSPAADDDWSGVFVPQAQETDTGPDDTARPSALIERLKKVIEYCELRGPVIRRQLDAATELSEQERSSLSRFVSELEEYAYDSDDCDYAQSRLKRGLPHMVLARDALKARPDSTSARQRAEAILARPEFLEDPARQVKTPKPDEPEPPPDKNSWWERFKRWLRDLLKPKPRQGPDFDMPVASTGGWAFTHVLVGGLLVAVVGLLVYLLVQGFRKKADSGDGAEVTEVHEKRLEIDPMSALSRPPEGWAHLADELAAKGNFREAVRNLYLALLSHLHRAGAIDYDPAKSNWDYFRGFKGRDEWLPPFRELTRRFDFAYYGNIGANDEGYRAFRSLSQPLLSEQKLTDSLSEASLA